MRQILVVDDNASVLKATTKCLERHFADARINAATTGDDAIVLIEANEYDVVVSDVEMPDMNGFALQDQVRSIPGRAQLAEKFIFHTGGASSREIDEKLQKARFIIRKGALPELIAAVQTVLASHG